MIKWQRLKERHKNVKDKICYGLIMVICIEFTKIYEKILIKKFYFRAFSLVVLPNISIFKRDVQDLIPFLNYRIIKKKIKTFSIKFNAFLLFASR